MDDFIKDVEEIIEPTPEPTPEPAPTPEPEKKESLSKTDSVKKLIRDRVEQGFEIKDQNSIKELNKSIIDELKLSPNWRSQIKTHIKKYCEESNISLSDLGFKNNKIAGMTVNLEGPNVPTEPGAPGTGALNPGSGINPGNPILPKDFEKTEGETKEEKEPEKKLSRSAQKSLISKGLNGLLVPLYTSLGIVEPDEEEKDDEEKLPTAKKFRKDVDDFAGELDQYLVDNEIQLPQFLSHVSILLSFGVLFILPVVKFKMFNGKSNPKPKYDSAVDDLKVKA